MGIQRYVDLESALGSRDSIAVNILDIERTIGEDWLLEFSHQANQLGARVDPHTSNDTMVMVSRI